THEHTTLGRTVPPFARHPGTGEKPALTRRNDETETFERVGDATSLECEKDRRRRLVADARELAGNLRALEQGSCRVSGRCDDEGIGGDRLAIHFDDETAR